MPTGPMRGEIKVGDGITTVAMGDTLVSMWSLPAEPARVRWLTARLNEVARTRKGSVLHMMFILSTASPPGAEARKLFQSQVVELDREQKLRQFVVVAVGDSFWINIVRTIGRTILFMAGKSHLLTLVDTLDEGLSEMKRRSEADTPGAAALTTAAQDLARALGVETSSVPGLSSAHP